MSKIPRGFIELLGYRWHCGECAATEVFTSKDEDGMATTFAVDQADAAGWRETARRGWLCPPCARKVKSLAHTFMGRDGSQAR